MSEVLVFKTHIEVFPYEKGDCAQVEKMLSRYDSVAHRYIPIAYYIEGHVMYLPRGINLSILETYFHTTAEVIEDADPFYKITKGSGLFEPKSIQQAEAIRFLCSEEEFKYTNRYPQYGLNLNTGDGKTYATIVAILKLKMRAIIITHQEKIKQQWLKCIKEMTTFPEDKIVNIDGSSAVQDIIKGKLSGEIYLCNHQTLHAYASEHGWDSIRTFFKKIHVGIKCLDEAHKFFGNTLMLDNFSNVYKTIYLTATFGRTDPKEEVIYKKAFSSVVRFGEQTIDYETNRKHIHFVVVYFQSRPEYGITPSVRTQYGFSSYKYMDYQFNENHKTLQRVLLKILDDTKRLKGRRLILTPKTDTADKVESLLKEFTDYDVGVVHSKRSQEENKENLQKEVISSTIKSIGEGADLKGLRILINLEPVASPILASQVCGRLREYSPDDDTYLFYPVDTAIPDCIRLLRRIIPVMKKKCKEIIYLNMEV